MVSFMDGSRILSSIKSGHVPYLPIFIWGIECLLNVDDNCSNDIVSWLILKE